MSVQLSHPGPDLVPVGVVTGAASGIGEATARELARRGYRIGLLDRDGSRLKEVAASLANEFGTDAVSVQCDVTDLAAVQKAVATVTDAFGGLSAAVACAGIEVLGDVETLTDQQWSAALDVNAGGVFRLAKATMPHLRNSRGAFVAVASDAGVQGAQGYSAYVASKHAVVGLIRCLALDFGVHGVRSNVVCPSFVETPMAHRIFADSAPEEVDYYRGTVPLGRFASSEEVAKVIAHLAGPDASYTNGLVYNIDGGSTAGYYVGAAQDA